jgi:Ca-activated chloride channel family protein
MHCPLSVTRVFAILAVGVAVLVNGAGLTAQAPDPPPPGSQTNQASTQASPPEQEATRFRSGVDLVNVTVTVSDEDGRFVPDLRMQDFQVFENGKLQEIALFSNERVPVSLGILLDASGSMTPEKMAAARSAIERFAFELLGKEDELFFVEFANRARVTQTWTTDRLLINRALGRVSPDGGTAMYDAIAEALPIAATGKNRKKALLVISDGNDTNSRLTVSELRQRIVESEIMVYALGVDGQAREPDRSRTRSPWPNPFPLGPRARPQLRLPFPPRPFPVPGGGGRRGQPGRPPVVVGPTWQRMSMERVNAEALREITDDSGGRTEIVHGFGDLDAATSRLADELRKQYYLGYSSTEPKDGRWHTIRVDTRDRHFKVRARRGYVAS